MPYPASWGTRSFFVSLPGPAPDTAAQLEECRAFRARVFHEHGRRPAFRASDGSFQDPDPLDFGSWHHTVRQQADGLLAGYIRLTPPGNLHRGAVRALLGHDRFTTLLERERVDASICCESGRLAVDPAARGQGLASYLSALVIGQARALGAGALIGTSVTAGGEYRMHQKHGARLLPDSTAWSEQHNEPMCVILHPLDDTGHLGPLVRELSLRFTGEATTPGTAQGPA